MKTGYGFGMDFVAMNPGAFYRKLANRIRSTGTGPTGNLRIVNAQWRANLRIVNAQYGSRYGFSLKWVWIQGADSMRAIMRYGFRVWIFGDQVWISVKRHTIFIKRYGFGCRLYKFNTPYISESAICIFV